MSRDALVVLLTSIIFSMAVALTIHFNTYHM